MSKQEQDSLDCWGVYVKDCVTRKVLSRLADKWTILVVGRLSERTYRFGELRRAIGGISSKVLTQTLRSLEEDGLVLRTVFPTNPPSVEYTLTSNGQTLVAIALQFKDWVENHALELENYRTPPKTV